MTVTLEQFVATIRQSRLVPQEQLAATLTRSVNRPQQTARNLADVLIEKSLITKWQAEKLLAGKHRGYFLGQYKLQSLIGKGGMSSVYLAEHRFLKRPCAIKVLPLKQAENQSLLMRFQREARAVAQLDHPNIVRAFDSGVFEQGEHQVHFIVMEYVDGPTLFEVVREKGPLSPRQAADVIRQAARGLAHAHAAGLVHRDMKPENLLLDRGNIVRIMDLGLAKSPDTGDVKLTIQQEGRVLGTANYCAPEQAIDSHRVDARADIYALGCTLYFLLTGRPPFNTGSLAQRLLAHQNQEPVAVETLRGDVPPALVRLLKRMMAKSPAARPQTAEAVAEELDRMLAPARPAVATTRPLESMGQAELAAAIALGPVGDSAVVTRFQAERERRSSERSTRVKAGMTAAAGMIALLLAVWQPTSSSAGATTVTAVPSTGSQHFAAAATASAMRPSPTPVIAETAGAERVDRRRASVPQRTALAELSGTRRAG